MAKIQIKNAQIADAINLKGLKAKLAKKKGDVLEGSDAASNTFEEEVQKNVPQEKNVQEKTQPKREAAKKVKQKEEPLEQQEHATTELKLQKTQKKVSEEKPQPKIQEKSIEEQKVEVSQEVQVKPVNQSHTPPTSVKESVHSSQAEPIVKNLEKNINTRPHTEQGTKRASDERYGTRQNQSRPHEADRSRSNFHANRERTDFNRRPNIPHSQKLGPVLDRPQPGASSHHQTDRSRNFGQRPPFSGNRPGQPPRTGSYERPGGYNSPKTRWTPLARPGKPESIPPAQPLIEKSEEKSRKAHVKPHPSPKNIEEETRVNKAKQKESANVKNNRKDQTVKQFDSRFRMGLQEDDEGEVIWRKKRSKQKMRVEQEVIRPTKISVRLPISIKDLASEMKLKASELIAKLFLQGVIATLNDFLTDTVTIQLLGQEFGCEIAIDTAEEEKIRITDKTISEEIISLGEDNLQLRPPVVAFMGHVDHGKTSLIDAIRKSNRAHGEVGAITQHIGAFQTQTSHGLITILDTPGHEAFSQMRERGAEVTDIVVLVVAGDEGMKQQTLEALNQAKEAEATIVVAINKCDKPNFNTELVYRQLADQELLPEAWGGQTITVNCSAVTGEGINQLLEMLALQAEVLELRANPNYRARGTVLESQMHKGLGPVATVIVQNGTLRVGDCLVFGFEWARVKNMRDEFNKMVEFANPSAPVLINGLSGLPEAGEQFIVVKNEKEAREIAEARMQDRRENRFLLKKKSIENMFEKAQDSTKKVLNLIIRADVQGSLEALKHEISKIQSKKVSVEIVSAQVGTISESDIPLAVASKAVILGFHVQPESHIDSKIKDSQVTVRLHNIIYHAVDDVKELMANLLDKIAQEVDKGKAEVKALFKSSQLGSIAGCQMLDGTINRNMHIRVIRNKEIIWRGAVASLKRHKDDVKEVQKGMECGILLQGYQNLQVDDILEAYEITYHKQEL